MAEDTPFDARHYAETMARVLDFPLDKANVVDVANNVAVAFRLAPLFLTFALEDEAEPSPVFDACEANP